MLPGHHFPRRASPRPPNETPSKHPSPLPLAMVSNIRRMKRGKGYLVIEEDRKKVPDIKTPVESKLGEKNDTAKSGRSEGEV